MVLIDLGDVSEPDRAGPGRRPGARWWRAPAAGVVAVVCLATLHSAPTGQPAVRALWTSPTPDTVLTRADRDTVWAHRVADGGGELTAYDLATGHVRWRRPTAPAAVEAGWFSVLPDAGIVFVPAGDGGTALDATTGAPLWRSTGSVEAHTADTVLLHDRDGEGRSTGLRLVRAGDGTTIWQRPVNGARAVLARVNAGRPGVVAVDSGQLALLRYDDGAPVHGPVLPGPGVDGPHLSITGDHLLVQQRAGDGLTVTAYRLDTLTESWRAEVLGGSAVQDCGPVVCLSGSRGISALDPATGVRRWELPATHGIWSVLGDRIVTSRDPRTSEEGLQPLVSVVDAHTGRRLGDEVAGEPVVPAAGEGRLLVLRPLTDPLGDVSVHQIDLATGHSRLIGEVGHQPVDVSFDSPFELAGRYLHRVRDGWLEVVAAG